MALDRDNAFYGYKAPTPTVDASDAAEKARIAAMKKANTASRSATFLEQVEAQIAKTTARLADVEAAQKVDIYGNPIIDPNSVEGRKAKVRADVEAAQAATPKPELTEQEIADGYIIKWIGTTNGKWQVIKPSAAVIAATRNKLEEANYTGSGTAEDPYLYKGKPFTGNKGVATYKNGILQDGGGSGNNNKGGTTGQTYTAPDGKIFTDLVAYNAYIAQLKQEELTKAGQSAYDLLFQQFNQFGMGALVEPLKQFIQQGLSSSEFTLRLRDTDAYKKRFAANASRIAKGLSALNEAEYIGLEDQYQNIMRQYGLPASYYTRGDMGRQEGFEKFLANDVSAAELEDRVMTAQSRVLNANPEVSQALRQFYPDITNGDILAYTLDPEKALTDIKRKVTAAEIGGAAIQSGLQTGMARAEELGAAGVTKAQAQQGYGTIGGGLQRGSQLAAIYGEDPYTQTTAEKEVFGLAGKTEAEKQRKKLTGLEKATFSGQTGISSGALARDRAGAY
jgi:hypothetical protein